MRSTTDNLKAPALSDADRSYLERAVEYYQGEIRHRTEVGNELGQATLKSLMLVNGGAILSLLTFIGNTGTVAHPDLVKDAMLCFGFGISANLIAYFCAYLSQNAFMFYVSALLENSLRLLSGKPLEAKQKDYRKIGNRALYGTIARALGSLGCFVGGALTAMNGIL